MAHQKITKVSFYSREGNAEAQEWQTKIVAWLREQHPDVVLDAGAPEALIVLGGDGTIMEAARKYACANIVLVGINLGQLGFLASVDDPKNFPTMLDKFFAGDFESHPGMIIQAQVVRSGKTIFSADAFNEVVVQNPLGLVEIAVHIAGEVIEEIRGSGVLVATPSGSTAYNLSAHGPVIVPNIQCLVVTELFDHDLPTPSLVVPLSEEITLDIKNFREHKLLELKSTNESADVLLIADGTPVYVLQRGDVVRVTQAPSSFTLAVLERNHFFKSLRSKFSFK